MCVAWPGKTTAADYCIRCCMGRLTADAKLTVQGWCQQAGRVPWRPARSLAAAAGAGGAQARFFQDRINTEGQVITGGR